MTPPFLVDNAVIMAGSYKSARVLVNLFNESGKRREI